MNFYYPENFNIIILQIVGVLFTLSLDREALVTKINI